MKFIHHLKGLRKIPYTLRSYAKGLEQVLKPIIQKMETIKNRITNSSKFYCIINYPFFFSIILIYTSSSRMYLNNII